MSLVYPGSDTLVASTENPPGSQPLVRPQPIIKADALSYTLWELPELTTQHDFLIDFGMLCAARDDPELIMRGHGTAPYLYVARKAKKHRFVGMGFTAVSRDDLNTLSQATGKPVEALERPGGGEVVRLADPNGLVVEVCYGIAQVEAQATRENVLPVNTPTHKARVNQGQRSPLAPAPVMKLGHCVTGSNNMEATCSWYMEYVGLIASDVLCLEDGSPVIAFMRLDRGDLPADHHCFVAGKGAGEGYLHSAYEVVDLDALGQGQQILKSKKYQHVWGIGRHLLGSQLFDYWKDPHGMEFEHYADGDVFTSDYPTTYHPMDPGNVYSWGPDIPGDMLKPSPAQLLGILKGLFNGSVSLKWLKTALKATSRPARPWL